MFQVHVMHTLTQMDSIYASCVLLACLALAYAGQDGVTVTTNVGTFIGFQKSVAIDDGRVVQVSKFLGVPYAEPPVGELRFRKPVAKSGLVQPLVTREYGPECVQVKMFAPDAVTSEDCLYLNVYVPNIDQKGDEKLAVMVWIHGGGFFAGSANVYVADQLAATGGVVVVTINYRLSALGFLNVGDDNAPGNYGLWDQHLAINWVHHHIGAFGGDPDRVTIFGESAGSASVIYQGLYPGNKGLFQRIIAQSGSAVSPWASTKHAFDEAKELAALVGCATDNNKEMVDCLKDVPADKIEDELNSKLIRNPFPFMPSVDNGFLNFKPGDIFDLDLDVAREERATLASFDLLIGSNYAEGATCLSPFCGVTGDPNEFMPSRSDFVTKYVSYSIDNTIGKDAPSIMYDLVAAEYTDWTDPENPLSIRDQFVAMHGDAKFVASTQATIDLHANKSQKSLYMYQFTAEPDTHIIPMPSWVKKAVHAEDLMFVFGSRANFAYFGAGNGELKDWEKDLSYDIMTLWSNFAKTGNPNSPLSMNVDWPQFTTEKHSYLEISNSLKQAMVKERLNEGRANLWNRVLPKIYKSLKQSEKSVYDSTCEKPGHCDP